MHYLPITVFPSPISWRSSISSHILGYWTLTSSMSTVSIVNPARPRRLETSRVSVDNVRLYLFLESQKSDWSLVTHVEICRLLARVLPVEEMFCKERRAVRTSESYK